MTTDEKSPIDIMTTANEHAEQIREAQRIQMETSAKGVKDGDTDLA